MIRRDTTVFLLLASTVLPSCSKLNSPELRGATTSQVNEVKALEREVEVLFGRAVRTQLPQELKPSYSSTLGSVFRERCGVWLSRDGENKFSLSGTLGGFFLISLDRNGALTESRAGMYDTVQDLSDPEARLLGLRSAKNALNLLLGG